MATVKRNMNDPNIIRTIKEALESKVRKRIERDITETLVAEYRIAIGKQLAPMIKGITIETLECLKDYLHWEDDFNVYVKIADEGKGT